jgi:hypothetical protein
MIVYGFDYIIAASQFIALPDHACIACCREHDYRDLSQFLVLFDSLKDLQSIDLWHADIQQQYVFFVFFQVYLGVRLEQEVQNFLSVLKLENVMVNTG